MVPSRLLVLHVNYLILFIVVCVSAIQLNVTQEENKLACPNIVSRADWKAKPPKARQDLKTPVQYIIIHHTDWEECASIETCSAEMLKMQAFHQGPSRNWSDIGYNYCVGQDGRVYEGRGWNTIGAHAPWYNAYSIGICIMGDFMKQLPNKKSIEAVFSLINCAVENNKLVPDYIMYGHRQVRTTLCPGDDLFQEMSSWPHWKPGQHYPPEKYD